ncbi:hypothetical protein ACFC58_36230 [Kitasatospora purpeofusca]|uniref:hypothetical protein n=1 Tax=Kitasatospora purpeofusca TaxID=67352 RepID=UPI0035E09C15
MARSVRSTFRWSGDRWLADARRGAADGLESALEHLLGASRRRVPLDEGTLERSGTVSVDRSALEGAVSYDGPYAVRQHEELDWQHLPGRTAKYLEGPLAEERPVMMALIAAAIRRAGRESGGARG